MNDPLLALLAGHAPADAAEADDVAAVRALLLGTAAPRSRAQYVPGHLTASAVVLDPERRRALLVLHVKLGRWLQPGGHLEPGEDDPARAAEREVLEETGLAARPPGGVPRLLDVDVHEIPGRPNEPAHRHYDLRYLLVAEALDAAAGDGTAAVRWVTPAEAAALDLDPGLRRALAKAWGAG